MFHFACRTVLTISICLLGLGLHGYAMGNTEKVLHSFCKYYQCYPDGGPPAAKLIIDSQGNLYGTNYSYPGSAFELEKSDTGYTYKVLHIFCQLDQCSDGGVPSKLIMDVRGNMYGLATAGGGTDSHGYNWGTVFELSPEGGGWSFRKIYDYRDAFSSSADFYDATDLTYAGESKGALYDGTSPLYGTTDAGGSHNFIYDPGTVFQLTRDAGGRWTGNTLYRFCSMPRCRDGHWPATLTPSGFQSFFGTTADGGWKGYGAIFKLSRRKGRWEERTVYSVCGDRFCKGVGRLSGALTLDAQGTLYGTSYTGGTNKQGAVFKITPKRSGAEAQLLHSFCSTKPRCADGQYSYGGVVFDNSGGLVGTTAYGGNLHDEGTVFRLSEGKLTVLYSFCPGTPDCVDGKEPQTGVTIDAFGNIFGTTTVGGKHQIGVAYKLKP